MRFFISRSWKNRKLMIAMLIIEFPFTVAMLTLFGIANPNLYRTALWQEGADLGFNSAPSVVVYAMANYRPVSIPLVWSQFITTWNLVISVVSMFILLVKTTMFTVNMFYPILSLLVHVGLIAIYGYSIHGQIGHDTLDPSRPSTGLPWYIGHSCGLASTGKLKGYCLQAKACFVVAILMVVLFSVYTLIAIHSMIPTKQQRLARASKIIERQEIEAKLGSSPDEDIAQQWEMHQWPGTPGTVGAMKSPATPRTRAFNMLGAKGDLPLRQT
ncbi:hypothetical protein K490DRAFT_41396 [Saccharata proteae CBS 121410]|uniref:Uncharacterized protein n=1 Tax=Saccharata proteae CBS 121410 TaxID=1314787 RepID=A0A9P4HWG3_9PEZI|nr:hypothetical protein K490DRAFT_41396 [Saccharata proteae CBS 121410]